MSSNQTSPNLVVVRAKQVDSDAVAETHHEVEIPPTEGAQRRQLAKIVAEMHPQAEMRSFANDAATFLDHKLLIIAVYERRTSREEPAKEIPDSPQHPQLFAA